MKNNCIDYHEILTGCGDAVSRGDTVLIELFYGDISVGFEPKEPVTIIDFSRVENWPSHMWNLETRPPCIGVTTGSRGYGGGFIQWRVAFKKITDKIIFNE